MKIAVLGGLGLQGRAAITDLVASDGVEEIVCVDTAADGPARLAGLTDLARVRFVVPEGAIGQALATVLDDVDAVIDLLPQPLMREAVKAAIATRTPLVTTNYAKSIADLAPAAEQAGVSIMTECGLDPGIDLVLYARAARQFDSISSIDSYCGGIPEPKAMAKPLCYKVSWNFDMVLVSQNRDSVMIEDGNRVAVPAGQQHDNPFIHEIEVAGLGRLEAFPNGDALHYVEMLDAAKGLRRSGRYTLRWPGWSAFWAPLKELGFLSEDKVPGTSNSPREFLGRLLGPQLQYGPGEKDLCVMRNVFSGLEGGRAKTVTSDLIIERDLVSGLFGMSLGVGYPASIVAQMLARGEITRPGFLNPLLDVPDIRFFDELARRGITVSETVARD
ncbi:saccharopine dehydrogenase family protein [Mesorhizobium sp. M7A.F.Ca.US.006.04.2.1]|uniref:saccharopine dehydrogenase family protein n=1 Tax=unclassified Mesorhizobium TaxID=325217 RepID=UPI000FCA7057|nr:MULTISPECIES: saccharopine dehydrogenase family protein [unclassified Mesorhizobium]RUX71117.1 saccharopine dehydrogenase family protein [Mesorhizobium sp. M7A.F.Ca.US.005.03.1.1]RUY15888.1 saccharopine dehydrogenase family protein [Mesorhizobium sp. M7A.F.Ca.US.005.03.2.1]RUY28471.1 saccharopine dehydrogenase family protein [Mesorhizobium sp. M7A.F.Ca.US.001.04.2.1]RUY42772.1 saccharopine dehydrogenase family protein [Mesorhizobium sp. M7A.F.Ca.US.001.04.1.1]RVA01839.1 saccharopine dehydro